MGNFAFEERVINAGYSADFSHFEKLGAGEFYRFGPNKCHWMVKNTDGSRICGDWTEKLPRVSEGSGKKYEQLNINRYSTENIECLYLARKGVLDARKHLSGLLIATDHLCVPVHDINGILITYQKIFNDGEKKFLSGYPAKNGHYIIGDIKNHDRIILCEGLATGCSLFLSTGLVTVITFGSGNLGNVVGTFRRLFPKSSFLIAGDRGNGEKAAYEAASQYECHVAIPDFKDEEADEKNTDFNDLHTKMGIEEVKNQIEYGFKCFPQQSEFPITLLEDCFDEEQTVYKKYKINIDGNIKEIWIKGEDFADRKKIEGIIKKYNLFYDSEQTNQIISFMKKVAPLKSNIMNNECGWRENGDFYLPPLEKPCVNTHYKPFTRKGNLIDFKKDIFPLAEKNPLIIFVLSYAFLPLFLKDFNIPNFGIHLYGQSSTGKTTLLNLAASIWGAPVEKWNGTLIGLEDLAYRYKDTLFCLDEINQLKTDVLYQIIYMLGNGGGRIRFRSKDIFQSRAPFRINYLSTGESKIEDKLKDEFTGGQGVRILDVSCHRGLPSFNNGKDRGIFDSTTDSVRDITLLQEITEKYQNVAIDPLIKNFEEAKNIFSSMKIKNQYHGQLHRIKEYFIEIEKAALTAQKLGCLPDFDISGSVEEIFKSLDLKENSSYELEIAKKRLYALIIEQEAFFYSADSIRVPYKIKGYKRGEIYYIAPPTLKNEICENINYLSVKGKLIQDKIIEDHALIKINKKAVRAYKVNELWVEQYGED